MPSAVNQTTKWSPLKKENATCCQLCKYIVPMVALLPWTYMNSVDNRRQMSISTARSVQLAASCSRELFGSAKIIKTASFKAKLWGERGRAQSDKGDPSSYYCFSITRSNKRSHVKKNDVINMCMSVTEPTY